VYESTYPKGRGGGELQIEKIVGTGEFGGGEIEGFGGEGEAAG